MTSYRTYFLGDAGLQYLQEVLREGLTLARFLSSICGRGGGTVATRMPGSIDPAALFEFDTGGKLPASADVRMAITPSGAVHTMIGVPDTNSVLAEIIAVHLGQDESAVCILENQLARAADPDSGKRISRRVFLGDEVYHLLDSSNASVEFIEAALRESASLPTFVGALSTFNLRDGSGTRHISERDLARIARRAEKVFVGAYDGEGYIIWSKER